MNTRTFGEALYNLRQGKKVTRWGWNGKGMWLALQEPDDNSQMSKPYIYIAVADGNFVPWTASQTDLLAEDWEIVD